MRKAVYYSRKRILPLALSLGGLGIALFGVILIDIYFGGVKAGDDAGVFIIGLVYFAASMAYAVVLWNRMYDEKPVLILTPEGPFFANSETQLSLGAKYRQWTLMPSIVEEISS